jgi:hypothetical protein
MDPTNAQSVTLDIFKVAHHVPLVFNLTVQVVHHPQSVLDAFLGFN